MKQICLYRLVRLCSSKCISSWNSRVSEVGEGVFHRARMGFFDRGNFSGFFIGETFWDGCFGQDSARICEFVGQDSGSGFTDGSPGFSFLVTRCCRSIS